MASNTGKPLFPERRAYTVEYQLSDAEAELYSRVTEYVREEFNRAVPVPDSPTIRTLLRTVESLRT